MAEYLRGILCLVRKELLAILKDPASRNVLLLPALLQSLMFGYAATFDLKQASYALLDQSHSAASTELVARLEGAGTFKRVATLQRPADDREIDVVDEHAPLREAGVVTLVDLAAEVVVETRGNLRLDLAADDVGIDGEAAVGEGADQIVAPEHSHIDFGPIRRLKRKPVELDEIHQESGFRSDDPIVDVTRIGQMRRDGQFPPRHGPKRQLVLQRPQHL